MKLTKKHIIIGSLGVLALGLMSFTSAKTSQAKAAVKDLIIGLHRFRTIGMNGITSFVLRIDLSLRNTSAVDFEIDTKGTIKPKVLRVYLGDDLIGDASLGNLSKISLKSGETAVLEDIAINISGFSAAMKLYELYRQANGNLKEIGKNSLKALRTETDIEAFGQIVQFKQNFI